MLSVAPDEEGRVLEICSLGVGRGLAEALYPSRPALTSTGPAEARRVKKKKT